jgi:hypothetical protein
LSEAAANRKPAAPRSGLNLDLRFHRDQSGVARVTVVAEQVSDQWCLTPVDVQGDRQSVREIDTDKAMIDAYAERRPLALVEVILLFPCASRGRFG